MYDTPRGGYPRTQLLWAASLLEGKQIQYPHVTEGNRTVKRAPKAKGARAAGPSLFDGADD